MRTRTRFEDAVGLLLADTYRIERKIGGGGMGVIYEASHTRLPRRFAVKVLARSVDDSRHDQELGRFHREAQVTATLHSPHVVHVFDYQVAPGGFPYLVMELLDGEDLAARLRRTGALSPVEALRVLDEIAEALDAAHAHGVIHRDLKPANIFLNREPYPDFVKVLDFGISRLRDSTSITHVDSIVGTPIYMSPEQTMSSTTVTAASDIFSFGSVAYELLTGTRAFAASSIDAILERIVTEQPKPVSEFLGAEARDVDEVFARVLSKNPSQRYPSAADFVAALRLALRPVMHVVSKNTAVPEAPPPTVVGLNETVAFPSQPVVVASPRRRVTGFVVGIVLLAVSVGVVASRRHPPATPSVTSLVVPTQPPSVPRAHIGLRISPSNARVELDGKIVDERELALVQDGVVHRLRVTKEGYLPAETTFDAHADRDLDITLRAIAALAPANTPHTHKLHPKPTSLAAPVQSL